MDGEKCPKGTCASCCQKWSGTEVQLIKTKSSKTIVMWVHWDGDKADIKNRVATGTECYKCFDARRSFYVTMSMAQLNTHRLSCEALNRKFSEDRFAKVNSIKVKVFEKCVPKNFIIAQQEENYDDSVREGWFYSLQDWCAKEYKQLKLTTMNEMRAAIKKHHPRLSIVRNKKGVLGVEVFETGPQSYRIRRGVRTSTTKRQEGTVGDEEDLDLEYSQHTQARMDAHAGAVEDEAHSDGGGDDDDKTAQHLSTLETETDAASLSDRLFSDIFPEDHRALRPRGRVTGAVHGVEGPSGQRVRGLRFRVPRRSVGARLMLETLIP